MWKVGESECDGYLTQQRKSISFTVWVKKGSYFSKGRGYRSTAKRSNMQSETAAWRFRQMPVFQAQMKCGFMSGMKDTAAGLCDLKKEEITGVPRSLRRTQSESLNQARGFQMKLSPLSASFQQPAWTSLFFFAPLDGSAQFVLWNWNILCAWKYMLPFVFTWLHIWPQELLKWMRIEHKELTVLRRHSASETWHMVHYSGYIEQLITRGCPVHFFQTLNEILLQNWSRRKDSSRTDRTKVFRIFNERTQDKAVFVVNTTPQKYQENTTPDISQRIKSWKPPYV